MRPVNVGVAHDNDATVAQFSDIEAFVNTRANGRDDILDFLVFQDFVQSHTLDIQDFTAQWQDGLEVAVTALFCAIMNKHTACQCKVMCPRNLDIVYIDSLL